MLIKIFIYLCRVGWVGKETRWTFEKETKRHRFSGQRKRVTKFRKLCVATNWEGLNEEYVYG